MRAARWKGNRFFAQRGVSSELTAVEIEGRWNYAALSENGFDVQTLSNSSSQLMLWTSALGWDRVLQV